jgi:hypothetical protein
MAQDLRAYSNGNVFFCSQPVYDDLTTKGRIAIVDGVKTLDSSLRVVVCSSDELDEVEAEIAAEGSWASGEGPMTKIAP